MYLFYLFEHWDLYLHCSSKFVLFCNCEFELFNSMVVGGVPIVGAKCYFLQGASMWAVFPPHYWSHFVWREQVL